MKTQALTAMIMRGTQMTKMMSLAIMTLAVTMLMVMMLTMLALTFMTMAMVMRRSWILATWRWNSG
jgi:hypothetical protein